MTNDFFGRSVAGLLVLCALALGACSNDDQNQARDARQNLSEATKQAAQAKTEQKQSGARPTSEQKTQQARTQARQEAKNSDQPVCSNCGTISSITPIKRNARHGSGVGAIAGGVAGGALGSQIGHGAGKTIAEIAGTLGGAYAGNVAEKHVRKVTVYQVNVAMDAGGNRTLTLDTDQGISTGMRVRVQGENIAPMQ